MSRYLIVGCSGCGKSTLAKAVSEICAIPRTETDSLYWQKDWRLVTDAEVVGQLPLDADSWVFDGNFVDFREQVWARADHIIWLNYPLPLILWRVSLRNLGLWLTQKPTWSGNRMPLSRSLSGIHHAFRQYFQKRKTFPTFLAEMPDKAIFVMTSPRQTETWLAHLKNKSCC